MALPQRPSNRPSFGGGGGGFNRNRFAPRREAEHRINHFIRVPKVRLVGDNVEVGVYAIQDAMRIAQEQQLDLVEISPNADPPVCKIIDYNKFLYDKKKKEKEIKAKAKVSEVKEIRFTPNTDDHDFDFKTRHAEGFLKDGFDALDAFLSHMWAVTIIGAPKKAAAQAIETLERDARGWYGGAVGMISLNESEVTKKLASYGALFAAPPAIAGIYGMNFENMPELKWKYGYFIVLGSVALFSSILFTVFKKSKWL